MLHADATLMRQHLAAAWCSDQRRGSAAGPCALILAALHTTERTGRDGYCPPVPLTLERIQRLAGFASHSAIAAGLQRLHALQVVQHDSRQPRDFEGRRLQGVAQTISVRDTLFAHNPQDDRDRALQRALGRSAFAIYPGQWWYAGHLAALPAGARYVLLILRAWEAVQDRTRFLKALRERHSTEAAARADLLCKQQETAAPVHVWADRARMDVRSFRAALQVLTSPVLTPAGGRGMREPYVTAQGGDWRQRGEAPCWFITTRLECFRPVMTFPQLNGPWAKIKATRGCIFGGTGA